jgi:hypothetical protein
MKQQMKEFTKNAFVLHLSFNFYMSLTKPDNIPTFFDFYSHHQTYSLFIQFVHFTSRIRKNNHSLKARLQESIGFLERDGSSIRTCSR